MAVSEERLSGAQYQEPDPLAFVYIKNERQDVAKAFLKIEEGRSRYRVSSIISDLIKLESVQEDVLRYPPVQVNMERDPDAVDEYTKMGWHEVKKPEVEDSVI
ncbi:hypothetical protein KW792_02365 [Candidatus Saccharibacteria bacterium]|nr:hypothetical protein [Candidatus Saccharibacteria bacterium]